jgi:thiamine transport system ATP-binding protein
MVSHNVEDAARIASRALVIADGRIAWDGQTDELLSGNAPVSPAWDQVTTFCKIDR